MSKYIFNNDAEILEFLEQLREKSIQIWAEGEKIRYRSKNGQLAPEILGTLKMAKGQILDFLRMVEKNVIPLTAIQTAYVVGQTAGCELGNVNAHYYIEYTIESLNVERLEQMINLVISKNDVLRVCTALVSEFPNVRALILQSGIAEGWSSYFSYILQELTVEKLKELDNNSDGILEISDFLNCIPDSTSITFSLYLLIFGMDKDGNMQFNEELDPERKGRFSIIDKILLR